MKALFYYVSSTVLLLAGVVTNVPAATQIVRMVNFGFQPRYVTNTVGDSVIWTNTTTTGHNVVGSNNFLSIPLFTGPAARPAITFSNAGTYGYYCSPHLGAGMTGIIYVRPPANNPPTVTLTAPTNNLALVAPATITLTATASDTGGSVTNVQFFNGNTLLGSDAVSPYSLVLNNLAAANYSFTARAFDNLNAAATSAIVQASVVDLRLSPTNLVYSSTNFPITLLVSSGRSYALEIATNFGVWRSVSNFVATSNSFKVNYPPVGPDRLFYRARVISGP